MIDFDAQGLSLNEKEVTAFVQQQMLDLAPHLGEKDALQVRLSQRGTGFEVELTAHHEDGDIQTLGHNEDLFEAIKLAKEGLLHYFVEVEDQLNPLLRDEKINYLSRHGNLYLH